MAIFALPFLIALVAFVGFRFLGANKIENAVIVPQVRNVSALAALPDGRFAYGDRAGRLFAADANAGTEPEPLGEVEVSSGEVGLIGLAADGEDIYASYVNADGLLTVASVGTNGAPEVREIWRGPAATEALGGRIAFDAGGRLVIGLGHLGRPDLVEDVSRLNGKFLILDPAGTPDQLPEVLSGGWFEPVAFTLTEAGELWVIDGAPEDESEIVARGDLSEGPDRVSGIRDRIEPSGLTSSDAETLLYCSSLHGELGVFKIDARGIAYTLARFPTFATDCELGVIALSDGRLVYSSGEDLRVTPAP